MKFFALCIVLMLFWALFVTLIGLLTIEAMADIRQERFYNNFTRYL